MPLNSLEEVTEYIYQLDEYYKLMGLGCPFSTTPSVFKYSMTTCFVFLYLSLMCFFFQKEGSIS